MKLTVKYLLGICLIVSFTSVRAADSLEIRIKFKSIGDIINFNQTKVPDNYQEYSWNVYIDSDNDPTTGSVGIGGSNGFDVGLSISHFKSPGSQPQQGTLVGPLTQKKTIILNGNSATDANDIRAFFDYKDSTLVMRASRAYNELADIKPGNRYVVSASYYSSSMGTNIEDLTTLQTIPQSISDPVNDISLSYLDIKKVTITSSYLGTEELARKSVVSIFPNPSNGVFKITGVKGTDVTLKVIDCLGLKVLETRNLNEIDLSGFPKGVYFVCLSGTTGTSMQKIILQ